MTDIQAVASSYLAMWNEPDPGRRQALVAAGRAAAGRYADPDMGAEGHVGIAAMIESARARFFGHGFVLRGQPDGHGPFARFSWLLGPAGGIPVAGGTDVARLDAEGRLPEVVGFLDGSVSNG